MASPIDQPAMPPASPATPATITGRRTIAPFIVGMLTLVLTLYLAFQSSELHNADLALREYQDLVNEHPQEKLYEAWKMFYFERVLSLSKPPTKPLDDYQKLAVTTRELGEKRSAILRLLVEGSELHILPPVFASGWSRWDPGEYGSGAPAAGTASTSYPEGPGASGSTALAKGAALPAAAARAASAPGFSYLEVGAGVDGCEAAEKARVATNDGAMPSRADLAAHMNGLDCFLRALNVSSFDYNYPMWPAIYSTRNKVSLLVAWLLPGLYGLLGACVFLMRYMLQREGAPDSGNTRALDVLSILLRIALGGLAGIIVGWFWVPNSATSTSPAITISSVSFGVAFLAGFSIEGLFGMLDRLNRTLVGADVSNRGESHGKSPVA